MSDWDGLKLCENCGDQYTQGRLCVTCAFQEMIDNVEGWMDDEYIGYDPYWETEQDGEFSRDHNEETEGGRDE